MRKPRATTTDRGYGWVHQQTRARAIRDMQDGDPCSRCGGPMYRAEAATLRLDHTDDRTGYNGLAHDACNARAGQALGQANRRARKVKQQRNTSSATRRSRDW